MASIIQIPISEQPAQKSWLQRGKELALAHPVKTALAGLAIVGVIYLLAPPIIAYFSSLFSSSSAAPKTMEQPPVKAKAIPKELTVFTSYTADNATRLGMSQKVEAAQRAYCAEKGYNYLVFKENLAADSLPYWSKIKGINQLLQRDPKEVGKYIIWVDDDAIFTNRKIHLDEFIHAHGGSNPNVHVIVSKDVPSSATRLNTGVMVVRHSDFSRLFFQKLWAMRHNQVPRLALGNTYANCPNQVCLHEQEAMHNLLKDQPGLLKHVKIIPQRDHHGVGMNTFSRHNHIDDVRGIEMNFKGDPDSSRYASGDFIAQCTGLATKGRQDWSSPQINLREACIDKLIQDANQ